MKITKVLIITIFFSFLSATVGSIEEIVEFEAKTALAKPLDKASPRIDGRLDEDIWSSAQWHGDFHQRQPGNGTPATYQTEFAIFYTDEYLIVGAKAYDPEPEKIRAILSRRDQYTNSDWLYVSIDSYNDNQTAFEFGINAAGVHHDLRRYNDNQGFDEGFDPNWEGQADINGEGWTAEWKIPFSELRFTSSDNMEWGFNVYRELPRANGELSIWNWWSNSTTGFVSRYGQLVGIKNIESRQPVVVNPYVASQTDISDNLVNDFHKENYEMLNNVGADIRYTATNGMAFTATINPDFGQVESDPADFNLTNFETYLPEKRPFFVEGSQIFNFPLGRNSMFYTRRIGRSPHASPKIDWNKYDESTVTESPELANIIGAAKISGKTEGGFSLGLLEAVTREETGEVFYSDGTKDKSTVEPLTNYFVTRVKQDFNEGATSFGGMITAVNRKIDGTGLDFLHESAYVGGLDFSTDFLDRNYSFDASVLFSQVNGDSIAIQNTQLSSARYFQRPDQNHSKYDPSATSLTGNHFRTSVSKNKGHIRASVSLESSSPGFEINDIGYNRQADNFSQGVWVQYTEWEPVKPLRRYSINTNFWNSLTHGGERLNTGGNINANLSTLNNYFLSAGIAYNGSGKDVAYNRGGPGIYVSPNTNFWVWGRTDNRKKVILTLNTWGNRSADNVKSTGFHTGVELQAMENLKFTFSTNINILDDTWAFVGKAKTSSGETRYMWSDALFQTINTTLRTDLTLSNNLSIQFYAQPYIAVGEYFNIRRVGDPMSSKFSERFVDVDANYNQSTGTYDVDENNDGSVDYSFYGNVDYNYKQFRSNLVLRWEYRMGSVLYLVWSQGYTDYERFKSLDYLKNMDHMFNTVGNNAIMLKMTYALNL